MRIRALLAAVALVSLACGDDDAGPTTSVGPTTTSSSSAGGGGTTAAGGQGAGGGASCGEPIAFDAAYDCDVNALTDMTGEDEVTIGYGFVGGAFVYEPKCLHVCAGTTVTFVPLDGTNFQIHPLQGGESAPDADSPFGYLDDPDVDTASFTLAEPGSYPYYCIAHLGSGMVGAVYVQ